jgi:hypothetical protein
MDHELLARLARTPSALAHLTAECGEERFAVGAAGDWSPQTILAHLRDDEYLCMRAALERMLAEETPEVVFVEGGDWEPGRNRSRDRKEHLLADFALQRQASIGILRLLRAEDWQRAGVHKGRRFTIGELVQSWVQHDAEHVAQLERAVGETLGDVLERRARMVDDHRGVQ